MLLFVFVGFVCVLVGLCYVEFVVMMLVFGSVYFYFYVIFGEGMVWFIGWCLVFEYLFVLVLVVVGWLVYLISFIIIMLNMLFFDVFSVVFIVWIGNEFIVFGKLFNLFVVFIVVVVIGLLYVGVM